jgi:hypothetical protein
MSRSPLAYPLVRSADAEVGGAADLQTDVMRFMAILALCLVAIFALVQAIPLAPVEPAPVPESRAEPEPVAAPAEVAPAPPADTAPPAPEQTHENVVLTRPKWVPKYEPAVAVAPEAVPDEVPEAVPDEVQKEVAATEAPPPPTESGFTLRFASDSALMRAVAAHDVGVYAIASGRALRMTVSESRISFWEASTPNEFHEMAANTVPAAVVDALSRAGPDAGSVAWGVTLPGGLRGELDTLMQEHEGGLLVIGANGHVHREASQ